MAVLALLPVVAAQVHEAVVDVAEEGLDAPGGEAQGVLLVPHRGAVLVVIHGDYLETLSAID